MAGGVRYRGMRSVADDLRARTTQAVRQLPLDARIALALALGDDDLDLYVRASGLERAELLAQPGADALAAEVAADLAGLPRDMQDCWAQVRG